MMLEIKNQKIKHKIFYAIFGILTLIVMFYYLSNTIIYFTTDRQFPISSLHRFPLTWVIFPAEIFSFLFAIYFVYVLMSKDYKPVPKDSLHNKKDVSVAILLPMHNEPKEIAERTLTACKKLRWPGNVNVYLLDDSDNPEDRKIMESLSSKHGVKLIRRKDRIGYKAGNINNAIKNYITEDYFAILDADQAPEPEFLEKTMDFFSDAGIAFVQTPQHFVDAETPIERAAKTGTNIFYRAQCMSKAGDGAIPFCGTNALFRTKAFREVNGFRYYTATEDIDLGIRINERGYRGAYVPIILVKGYAPKDFKAYSSQQYRWANGNLAILREYWLKIIGGNFSFMYQVHMFFTIAWWLIGFTTLLYILVPIAAVTLGWGTHHAWLPDVFIFFIFFHVLLGITMIYASLSNRVAGEKVKLGDAFLQYSLIVNSMFIYTRAAMNSLLFKKYIGFVTTNKRASASSMKLIALNLTFAALCLGLSLYSLYNAMIASTFIQVRTYLPVSIWLLFYSFVLFSSIIFVGKGRDNEDRLRV